MANYECTTIGAPLYDSRDDVGWYYLCWPVWACPTYPYRPEHCIRREIRRKHPKLFYFHDTSLDDLFPRTTSDFEATVQAKKGNNRNCPNLPRMLSNVTAIDCHAPKVLEVETVKLTPELRRRLPFLGHLPIHCDVSFLEVDMVGLVSEATTQKFREGAFVLLYLCYEEIHVFCTMGMVQCIWSVLFFVVSNDSLAVGASKSASCDLKTCLASKLDDRRFVFIYNDDYSGTE